MAKRKPTANALLTEEITVVTPWLLITLIIIVGLFAVLQYIT